MKRLALLAVVLLSSAYSVSAATCAGFSVVPSDHVVVKYSTPLAVGATHLTPVVTINGSAIHVSRSISGGSLTDVSCVDDTIDLGTLGGGRYDLTWSDTTAFTTQHATLTFAIGKVGSGGNFSYTGVVAPVVPDQPVLFEVSACSPPPAAYVLGNDVRVMQYRLPSCQAQDGTALFKRYFLDLGPLASGVYNVTNTTAQKDFADQVLTFRFVVQQPPPASPCSNGGFSLTRTPNGTVRLHYEDSYHGYTPTFSPPTVTSVYDPDRPSSVSIIQPVADIANSQAWGAPPSSTICHAEELDLGPLGDGYHTLGWVDQLSVNGLDFGGQSELSSFWWQNGRAQCTSFPQLLTPSPALEGAPFDVAMNILAIDWQSGAKVTVNGHNVTVDVDRYYEGSGDDYPVCRTYKATVNPLPAGEYTLVWRYNNGNYQTVSTSQLTVAKPTRKRAIRH